MASKKIMVDIMVVDKNATRTINQTGKAIDGLAKSTEQLAGRTSKNKAESGLNNAILLETSRLASDASYGFQGMANNLGQLVSLVQISAKNSGGFAAALKDVGKSLMGVGGLMVGIQLLISFLPQISKKIKELRQGADELSGAFDDMKSKVDDTSGRFETYISVLESSTSSDKQKEIAIKKLNKEFPDYIQKLDDSSTSLDDVKNKTEAAAKANNDYRESIIDLAMSQAAQSKIQEIQAGIVEKETENILALRKVNLDENQLTEEFNKIQEKRTILQKSGVNIILSDTQKAVENAKSKIDANNEVIKSEKERIDVLKEFIILYDKDGIGGGKSTRRGFLAGQLDFDKEIVQSQIRVSASLRKNKDQQIQINAKAIKEIAKLRQSDFAERQQQKVNTIKNDKDRAKAQIDADKAIAESRQSLNEYLSQIDKETERKVNDRRLRDEDKATELLEKGLNERIIAHKNFEMSMARNDFDKLNAQKELEKAKTENILDNLERQRTAAIVAGEETIGIEQQITNAKEALAETNKKIDRDEADAKLATANYVAQAITAIAGEGSALGKAVSVAMATMNTYEAVTAALGAKPYGPWNIAQAAATAAFGFLQVKKILATKLPVGGGSGGGVGGAAPSVEAPDFNVVGASETSQLSMAVARTREEQKVNLVWDDLETYNNIADKTVNVAAF
jgi:hypothetical protein